jgi:hypothetical protein
MWDSKAVRANSFADFSDIPVAALIDQVQRVRCQTFSLALPREINSFELVNDECLFYSDLSKAMGYLQAT